MENTILGGNLTDAAAPLVSVCCLTYNHEKTVAQTLDAILSQRTDFPFEIIVHDDASTDGTQDIIRDYQRRFPDIVKPILQSENQMKRCNIEKTYICPALKGKYVAVCEGDDFWTDDDKLRTQISYMESHPECSMTFHAVSQLNSDGSEMMYRPIKEEADVPCELIIKRGGMFCPSASLVIRAEFFCDWPDFRSMADIYDYPRQILASVKGKVHYFDRVMACYRYEASGSWTANLHRKTNIAHVENEILWLGAFNDYSNQKYDYAISYHIAHLWFTEYRKNLNKEYLKNAKAYIKKLSFKDRVIFRALTVIFSVFGEKGNKIFELIKRLILK